LTADFYKYAFKLVHRKLSDVNVNDLVSCYVICCMYFYCCSSLYKLWLAMEFSELKAWAYKCIAILLTSIAAKI